MTLTECTTKFHDIEHFFFSAISTKVLDFDGVVSAYFTGVRSQYLNPIIHRRECTDISSILTQCIDVYRQEKTPWIWVSPADLITLDLETALKKNRANLLYDSTAMVCDLKDINESGPSQFIDVRCLQGDLRDWIIPVHLAFESTEEVGLQYKLAHDRTAGLKGSFFHVVGYLNSQPVCGLTLTVWQGTARIDDVATLPSHQGRGYGTELIKYTLSKARDLEAQSCFLEASEKGLSIYERTGFKPLFTNKCYGRFE